MPRQHSHLPTCAHEAPATYHSTRKHNESATECVIEPCGTRDNTLGPLTRKAKKIGVPLLDCSVGAWLVPHGRDWANEYRQWGHVTHRRALLRSSGESWHDRKLLQRTLVAEAPLGRIQSAWLPERKDDDVAELSVVGSCVGRLDGSTKTSPGRGSGD
jgi:hypothetical protein